jgi:hypothetical protein
LLFDSRASAAAHGNEITDGLSVLFPANASIPAKDGAFVKNENGFSIYAGAARDHE